MSRGERRTGFPDMEELPRVRVDVDAEVRFVFKCVVNEEAGMMQTYEEEVESDLMDESKVVLDMGEIELHVKEGRWSVAIEEAKRSFGKASCPIREAKYCMEYCMHYTVEAQRRLEKAGLWVEDTAGVGLRKQLCMTQARIQLVLTKYCMETAQSHMEEGSNCLEGPAKRPFNCACWERCMFVVCGKDATRRMEDAKRYMGDAKRCVIEALRWVEAQLYLQKEPCSMEEAACTKQEAARSFDEAASNMEEAMRSMEQAERCTKEAACTTQEAAPCIMDEASISIMEEADRCTEETASSIKVSRYLRVGRWEMESECSMDMSRSGHRPTTSEPGVWRLVRGAIVRKVERLRRAKQYSVAKVDPETDAEIANAQLASFIEHHIQRKLHLLQPDNPIGAASASATKGERSIVGDDMPDEIRSDATFGGIDCLKEVHSTVYLVKLGAPAKGKFNLCRNWSARLLSHPLLEPCLDELRRGGKDVKTPEGALILVRLDQYERVRRALTEHQKKEGRITFYHVVLATDVVCVEVLQELICHAFGAFAQRPRLKRFITELPLHDRREMLEDFNSTISGGTVYSACPLIVKNTFLIHVMDQPKLEDNFTRSANDVSAPHDAAADEEWATCQGLLEKPSTWKNPRRHATFCHCCQEEHRKLRKRVPVGRGMWNHSCRVFSEALAERQRARKNGVAEVSEPGVEEPEVLSQVAVAPQQDRKSGAMGAGHGSSSSSGLSREQGRQMQSRSSSSSHEPWI